MVGNLSQPSLANELCYAVQYRPFRVVLVVWPVAGPYVSWRKGKEGGIFTLVSSGSLSALPLMGGLRYPGPEHSPESEMPSNWVVKGRQRRT